MPKLLYTWYFEKFTASVTSSGHSALRHEVSRICTILGIRIDLGLVALDSHSNSASFSVFEVYFKQNNKNIIFSTIFATFYFEIAVKWSKSRIFEKFQLDHAKNTW